MLWQRYHISSFSISINLTKRMKEDDSSDKTPTIAIYTSIQGHAHSNFHCFCGGVEL